MKPNLTRLLVLVLLTAAWFPVPPGRAAASDDEEEALKVARSAIKADRQAVIAEAMQLTEPEAHDFWPIYHQYRTEMDRVGDGLVRLVQDYGELYPDVPEKRARMMLTDLIQVEKDYAATRARFLKKFAKVLPASKTLRFAQVENRLDLVLRLRLASHIPLAPIEGDLSADLSSGSATIPGTPGGVFVRTLDLTAKVAAIDRKSRRVTLIGDDGVKTTVKAGPDVANFDQIRVGDQLKVRATEELLVQMAGSDETLEQGTAAEVALAPLGAKPGGMVAKTTQIVGKVIAIDEARRTATLQFEDGITRTFSVRQDLDLGQHKVGEKVVFRVTEMLAITVGEP